MSSKDNVIATAMPVPLPTEYLGYDPSINLPLLETLHESNVFVSPIIIANYVVMNGIKLRESE